VYEPKYKSPCTISDPNGCFHESKQATRQLLDPHPIRETRAMHEGELIYTQAVSKGVNGKDGYQREL
jgi:hypothetical protein